MQMQDTNDGIVFMAPLETLRKTAATDIYLANEVVKEPERRIVILWGEDYVKEQLVKQGLQSKEAYIRKMLQPEPVMLLPQAQAAVKAE